MLSSLPWPGNVRELRNICEQLAVLHDGGTIGAPSVERIVHEKLSRSRQQAAEKNEPFPLTREIVEALLEDGQTRQAIARQFGISRSTLWRTMREWEMSQ
jgi:propionate catabolism operon transcriptional regulator